ncbi:E3 ubiquitin-protein ligase NEURL1B [Puma concolor]|uniref:RING-type E3 ubiquitin transferase n=1 Tax=Puma concolor TaxID=9696 RepID=A0A6P6HWS3_PUMCO|nr:E3 ubiquitin-protein ligase NEURL1B [Puma concolor]
MTGLAPRRHPAANASSRPGRGSRASGRLGGSAPAARSKLSKDAAAAAPPLPAWLEAAGGGGGAGGLGPVGSASSRCRRLPSGARPSCSPPARRCSRDAPEPDPGPGARPTALLASVRPERAAADAAARRSDGQHGAPDPARSLLPYPSPPARLLATRPCCGPGPERRPVLGEAPRFHAQAKGKNVRLDGHSRRATRRNSFCNGVTFTQRPIRLYEQVRLRLVAVRPGWSGALRFGFTAHDPSLMSAQDIPKYACPDLVTRPGYWAKALPENLALRDTVLAYWADRHGRVFYSVNDGEPVLFHCGVAVGGPLWALIDVYGITDEVQLLGTLQSSPSTTSPSGSLSGSQDDSDSDMAFSVNQSSSASESSLVTAPSSPLSPPVSPVFSPPEPAGSKNGECTVCFDGEVDTVIYTCGHMCLCHSCGLRLKRQARACCPICRRPIKDVIKIYRP